MLVFRKFWEGIRLVAKAATSATTRGDLEVLSTDSKIYYHNGTINSPLLTEDGTAVLVGKTIDADLNTITNIDNSEIKALAAIDATKIADGSVTNTEFQYLNGASSNIQTQLNGTASAGALQAHIDDAVGAHAATAISITAIPTIAAIEVQGALEELQSDIDTVGSDLVAHIVDPVGAHAATAISSVPSGNLAAIEVQAALNELQGDIDTINVTSLAAKVTGPASATDEAIARFDGTTGKLIQNSVVTITDAGVAAGFTGITSSGTVSSTGTLAIGGNLTEALTADAAATGANATISNPATSFLRLTNASLTSVDMISAPVNGEVITIENATGTAITINNDTGGTAANRILTGTKAPLTLADEASIILKYDATEARWMVIGGTGSGSGGEAGCFVNLDASESLTTWSTGDNATFLGGGTLSGTFVKETTAPLNGLASYKYTQAAGSVNDYLASPAQSTALRFRGQTVTLSFPYTYNGASNDIEVIFYDVTNSAIIATSAFIQASTTVSIFTTNFTIPSNTTSIRIGFQTRVLSSGAIFLFDDISVCTDATAYASLFSPDIVLRTSGNAGQAITANVTNVPFIESLDSHNAWNGSQFTVPESGIYNITGMINTTTATSGTRVRLYIDAVSYRIITTFGESSMSAHAFRITDSFTAGQVLSFRIGDTKTLSNNTEFHWLNIDKVGKNSSNILTAPDTFSTDVAPLVFAGTAMTPALLVNATIGTFVTFLKGTNSTAGSTTQNNTAPTQTVASMGTNGILITAANYATASTAALPSRFDIQIGKNQKGLSLQGFSTTGKTQGNEVVVTDSGFSTTDQYGVIHTYSDITGILTIEAGDDAGTGITNRVFRTKNGVSAGTSGYITINASRNPALTGLNINSVAARGVNTAGTSMGSGETTIPYDATKTYDTHAALVSATGIFTAPESGYYQASWGALLGSSAGWSAGESLRTTLYKNGAVYADGQYLQVEAAATTQLGSVGSSGVYLTKGDTLYVTLTQTSGVSITLSTAAARNHFSIHKTSIG